MGDSIWIMLGIVIKIAFSTIEFCPVTDYHKMRAAKVHLGIWYVAEREKKKMSCGSSLTLSITVFIYVISPL